MVKKKVEIKQKAPKIVEEVQPASKVEIPCAENRFKGQFNTLSKEFARKAQDQVHK